jgi:hypothetical protein
MKIAAGKAKLGAQTAGLPHTRSCVNYGHRANLFTMFRLDQVQVTGCVCSLYVLNASVFAAICTGNDGLAEVVLRH